MNASFVQTDFFQHMETGEIYALQLDTATGIFVGHCGPLPLERLDMELLQNFHYESHNLGYVQEQAEDDQWRLLTSPETDQLRNESQHAEDSTE